MTILICGCTETEPCYEHSVKQESVEGCELPDCGIHAAKTSQLPVQGSERQSVQSRLTAMWQVSNDLRLESPRPVEISEHTLFYDEQFGYCQKDLMWYRKDSLFTTEKDAISAACKLRVAEVDRLTAEINALDKRIEEIKLKELDDESNARR